MAHDYVSFQSHAAGTNPYGVEVRTGTDASAAGLRPVNGRSTAPNGWYAVIERVRADGKAIRSALVGDGNWDTAFALVRAAGKSPLTPDEFTRLVQSQPGLYANVD